MSIDEENKIANDNLSFLRQMIRDKKETHAMESLSNEAPTLETMEVPEVTIAHTSTFSLDRHDMLCLKLEALYNNYLVSKNTLPPELKELAIGIEELLEETLNCRL